MKVFLTLKFTKDGYVEDFQNVAIPLGEEMTVRVNLNPRAQQITFQTDPPEAHVYLQRTKEAKQWNEGIGTFEINKIPYNKHLGTTPFTYYMDPSDPLEHGDQIIYRKSGYKDAAVHFVQGVSNYHQVLTPENIKER